MLGIIGIVFLLTSLSEVHSQEQAEHRNFQYNSAIDPLTGRYNFAYDTGNDNDIAHSLHMQYQDADGIVRGRYGYTDPRGKLRMVEYEAGPNGFIARGDVGPDMSLHDNAPVQNPEKPLSSYREGDFLLDPAPVQMAGWDPERNPIDEGTGVDGGATVTGTASFENESENPGPILSPFDRRLFPALNVTSNSPLIIYDPENSGYDERYPRLSISSNGTDSSSSLETRSSAENNPSFENPENSNLNVNNIDVNLEEIQTTDAESTPMRRSADGRSPSLENMQAQSSSRSETVKVATSDGRRLFYRDSHSMEPHEHYYYGPNHDSELYYYRPRLTHDHSTGRTYYRTYFSSGQTHDHDAERSYYRTYFRPRQTHDHDAERRYYRYRQNHDHDAEQHKHYEERVSRDGRLFVIDNHNSEPHVHSSQVYQNHADHQHSDVHLYARYRNSDYPATAKPRQLQYIPSDRYHDKEYYWTY